MTEELVKYETEQGVKVFQPVMSIEEMKDRYQMMARVTSEIMREGKDYGTIPGTGGKPSLFKPGAEKLATFFGLRKEFDIIEREEDWMGALSGGEPRFYYLVRCLLYRDDVLVAAADGSCNSWESRYRWRKAARVCPACKADAIIKGKAEYGGGWLCFKKRGGCGAKFKDGDKSIEGQKTGRVLNTDIFDQVNTVLKIAEKRALVATTLLAVGASEFFTQDMEDIIDAEWTEHEPEQRKPQPRQESARKDSDDLYGHPLEGKKITNAEKAQNGDGRPYTPDILCAKLQHLAYDKYSEQDGDAPTTREQQQMVAACLNGLCHDDLRRHSFTLSVFGWESTEEMKLCQFHALNRWMEVPPAGAFEPHAGSLEMLKDEANRLVNAAVTE